MMDIANVQPMMIDVVKPMFPLQQTKSSMSTPFLLKPITTTTNCEHIWKIPSLNNSHWTCSNCGVFISIVIS